MGQFLRKSRVRDFRPQKYTRSRTFVTSGPFCHKTYGFSLRIFISAVEFPRHRRQFRNTVSKKEILFRQTQKLAGYRPPRAIADTGQIAEMSAEYLFLSCHVV